MARRKNWLARVYKVHPSVVANICHGRTHRRVVVADPSGGISLSDVARRMELSVLPAVKLEGKQTPGELRSGLSPLHRRFERLCLILQHPFGPTTPHPLKSVQEKSYCVTKTAV